MLFAGNDYDNNLLSRAQVAGHCASTPQCDELLPESSLLGHAPYRGRVRLITSDHHTGLSDQPLGTPRVREAPF